AGARAQPGPRRPPLAPGPVPSATIRAPAAPVPQAIPGNIRAHVGADYVARLLRSSDPDERIRGIQRAAAIGSAETVALLVQATEAGPAVRSDTRALVELARGLAPFAGQERARAALVTIMGTGNPGAAGRLVIAGRGPDGAPLDEGDPAARAELAREIAAMALGRTGEAKALEALYAAARTGGSAQNAAQLALLLYPPREAGIYGTATRAGTGLPVPLLRLLGQLGDLRALDVLHAAARASDVPSRAAALVSLAELGDVRVLPLARAAVAESDARVRAAGGEALVLVSAPERFKVVAALVADESTAAAGIRLAERVYHADITRLLAPRASDHPDVELRAAAIRALGRSVDPGAADALAAPALVSDARLGYLAAVALARSPAENALKRILALAAAPTTAPLGIRAYVVRALVRHETSDAGDELLVRLHASRNARDRALGTFGLVALGRRDVADGLADPDARVRRAAAMAALAVPTHRNLRALREQHGREKDDVTRQVLAIGLLDGDDEGLVKTTTLVDRADAGGPDAALATLALARRADESSERKVTQLLGARDVVLRAHAARGLGASSLPDASGRLADAYAYETEAVVRRAIVAALAERPLDADAPARRTTLSFASDLDPDGPTRQAARLATAGATTPLGASPLLETAWLRVLTADGGAPGSVHVGSLVRSDGLAVPIAFDEDGFALVPGLPAGETRLALAPRLPQGKAPSP
ncbi:MAG: repeat protein, partial [Labilithrix sp.]|nr:repeat protein [Labilithrix sp.]